MISALSGIGKGVKILSNLNIFVAVGLMILAILVGPKVHIMNTMVETLGEYMQDFIHMSFRTAAGNPSQQDWIQKWTILYWSWWISWSPFVGIFIARISKGRTIREFITHVILIPSGFSFAWFSIFGVLSTNAVNNGAKLTNLSLEEILFGTLHQYHFGFSLSIIAIFLVFSFFITSADSATFVLAMQSEDGDLNPRTGLKVIWGVLLSVIAIVLLLAGGLDALQNVLIIVALPFSVILLLLTISLIIEVKYEVKQMGLYIKPKAYPSKDEPFRSYED
jgi:glycine betaine transporter